MNTSFPFSSPDTFINNTWKGYEQLCKMYKKTFQVDNVHPKFDQFFELANAIDFSILIDACMRVSFQCKVTHEHVFFEFIAFLILKLQTNDLETYHISPTWIMDAVWHEAVLNTQFYKDLNQALFRNDKQFIHHRHVDLLDQFPQSDTVSARNRMVKLYMETFPSNQFIFPPFSSSGKLTTNVPNFC